MYKETILAGEKYDCFENVRVIQIPATENVEIDFAIGVAPRQDMALKALSDVLNIPLENVVTEVITDPVNMGGYSGPLMFIIAEDAPGISTAWAMAYLNLAGYDIMSIVENYFVP